MAAAIAITPSTPTCGMQWVSRKRRLLDGGKITQLATSKYPKCCEGPSRYRTGTPSISERRSRKFSGFGILPVHPSGDMSRSHCSCGIANWGRNGDLHLGLRTRKPWSTSQARSFGNSAKKESPRTPKSALRNLIAREIVAKKTDDGYFSAVANSSQQFTCALAPLLAGLKGEAQPYEGAARAPVGQERRTCAASARRSASASNSIISTATTPTLST